MKQTYFSQTDTSRKDIGKTTIKTIIQYQQSDSHSQLLPAI